MNYKEVVVDVVSKETTYHEYTADEIVKLKTIQAEAEAKAEAAIAEAEAKEVAKTALFKRLGITADEAQLLLS